MIKQLQILIVVSIYFLAVRAKPTLDVENRNLCEDEPDLAECLKEVEEAKSTPMAIHTDEAETETDSHSEEGYEESLARHYEMIRKTRERSEKQREFWEEELNHMNQWNKYGL